MGDEASATFYLTVWYEWYVKYSLRKLVYVTINYHNDHVMWESPYI